ncbi:MAG: cyclic nucleotide-binding domain-containing protein [Anaerolineales bacterium]|nr:cyclic nucleotide-binding domain-containing protein [Anaerolineales bacterium]
MAPTANRTITPSQLEHLLAAEPYLIDDHDLSDNSAFLRLMEAAERQQFTQSFTERNLAPGEIVFREGEWGDTMYIVWSGRIAILKGDLDTPTILAMRGAGEIIGEMALLENQPRSATIVALENLRLMGLNRQKFHQLLKDTPSVSLSILEILSARLRKSDEARSSGQLSEKQLISQVSALQNEKQRLEALQRLRDETSELIIHDLRNPLNTITIALKMLSVMLPEEALIANRDILDVAKANLERMQRLVDSLLEVSRIESGQAQFVLSEFSLKELIEEVLERVSIVERKGIRLSAAISADLPPLTADRERIERVLVNLLDNALKYTPDNGSITLAAQVQDDEIQVSVTDTGPGIPPEDRQRIFERFAQGMGEKPRRRGFGLGLAYCRLAVERHGGRIWVEPGDNNLGSRFVFTLPLNP